MFKKYLYLIVIIAVLSSCTISNDKPPEIDSPLPQNHAGIYKSEDATFTFEGDGKTVNIEFSERYLELLELPPNNTLYSYAFTWYDFGEYRYDGATHLIIYHTDSKTSINFSLSDSIRYEVITLKFPTPENIPQELKRVSN